MTIADMTNPRADADDPKPPVQPEPDGAPVEEPVETPPERQEPGADEPPVVAAR